MSTVPPDDAAWARVLRDVIDGAHLATGDRLSALIDHAVRPLGLGAEVMVVDLAQQVLTPLRTPALRTSVVGTMAGRVYQTGEILTATDDAGTPLVWVPMLDGTDRVGVLRIELSQGPHAPDERLVRWLWTLSGLAGHILMTKTPYSDRLRLIRSDGPLSMPSELLWQLLQPRTFATDRVAVSAVLEPASEVAGDAYDYNVDGRTADLAVFDALGHDMRASLTTALALTAVRNARRRGVHDLVEVAGRVDDVLHRQPGPIQFATAVLGRLDTVTGMLDFLIAGHPPPLLVRRGRVVKELAGAPRLPLGVTTSGGNPPVIGQEPLEPGDRVLLYSDGVTEARDSTGEFFGEQRLVEFVEHAAADELSAPETLRRLAAAVLEHQGGRLQDDATLLLVDWSAEAHLRMMPALEPVAAP
ncbi:PP2C family protein-serine/threonine phosphatase [Actinomycetes bacterium KLBMP 9759]